MSNALTVLAVDEVSTSTFLFYVGALALGGVLLLVMAALPVSMAILNRVINGVMGAALLGYAFYLFFIFEGGEFEFRYFVFLIPIFAIFGTVNAIKEARAGAK